MKYKGIDVSHNQGEIDWDKVKASGQVDFAIIRSSYGVSSVDRYWERNAAEASRVGIPIGAYHYFCYGDAQQFQKEVDNFISRLKGRKFDLPVFIDFEESDTKYNPPLGSMGKETITNYALYAFEKIRGAGITPGIYASKYWLESKLDVSRFPDDIVVWLAEWKSKPEFDGLYQFWQFTSTGTVPGISGNVDLNRSDLLVETCPYQEPSKIFKDQQLFTGEAVRWFQWHLMRAGYDCGVKAGGKSVDRHGTDGIAGRKTWNAIEDVMKA